MRDPVWGWLPLAVDPWAGQRPWVDDGFVWFPCVRFVGRARVLS